MTLYFLTSILFSFVIIASVCAIFAFAYRRGYQQGKKELERLVNELKRANKAMTDDYRVVNNRQPDKANAYFH